MGEKGDMTLLQKENLNLGRICCINGMIQVFDNTLAKLMHAEDHMA